MGMTREKNSTKHLCALENIFAFLNQTTNSSPRCVSTVRKTSRTPKSVSVSTFITQGAPRGDVYITRHLPTVLQFKNALCHGTCRQVDKGSLGVWGTAARACTCVCVRARLLTDKTVSRRLPRGPTDRGSHLKDYCSHSFSSA